MPSPDPPRSPPDPPQPTVLYASRSATALHHAVWSGSLDAVKVLVEAGADLIRRDTIYDGTPLWWAKYGEQQQKDKSGVPANEAKIHGTGFMKQH